MKVLKSFKNATAGAINQYWKTKGKKIIQMQTNIQFCKHYYFVKLNSTMKPSKCIQKKRSKNYLEKTGSRDELFARNL
jgi:hypothetical protein